MPSCREARADDQTFILEMARWAGTIEDRPLPDAEDPAVVASLPAGPDAAVIAVEEGGRRLGAAWWHWHEPALVIDESGRALPEMVIAVVESARGTGIGTALIEALATRAADRFEALALNVHLRNPAARLYTRTGFRVAGQGRGWFGVAMRHDLHDGDAHG